MAELDNFWLSSNQFGYQVEDPPDSLSSAPVVPDPPELERISDIAEDSMPKPSKMEPRLPAAASMEQFVQGTIMPFAPGWKEEPHIGEKFPSTEDAIRRLQAYAFMYLAIR
jgi:hypothetical protein